MNPVRWALVTGGAQGIGRAVVWALQATGLYRVAAVDRDAEALRELDPDVVPIVVDVAAADAPSRILAGLAPHTDRLGLLVNNAGIMEATPPAAADWASFDAVLAVNLRAPYVLTTTLLPLLLRGDRPSIVNIASTRALMSEPNTEAYAASKGGLVALTHALAVSLGPQVRVNVVSPGWIEVGPWQKASRRHSPALTGEDHAQHPAGRVGSPDDVARAVLFLANPDNGFVTGAHLVVDGGMTRKMIYHE